MSNIDWDFIAKMEGGRSLIAYVPERNGSPIGDSGVTVGMGIDLGQMTGAEAESLPAVLQLKLRPYLGLTRGRAMEALDRFPLHLSPDEAVAVEQPARATLIGRLSNNYSAASGEPFDAQPGAAQTVMADVTWQYGSPWNDCPHFWAKCCARDWHAVYDELMNFGDQYQYRRRQEAEYLSINLPL